MGGHGASGGALALLPHAVSAPRSKHRCSGYRDEPLRRVGGLGLVFPVQRSCEDVHARMEAPPEVEAPPDEIVSLCERGGEGRTPQQRRVACAPWTGHDAVLRCDSIKMPLMPCSRPSSWAA